MFQKVLVVEDLDTVGYGISTMLGKDLGVVEVVLTQYCDDAYLKIETARLNQDPFDLLITDLSFVRDHRPRQMRSGTDLIEKLRNKKNDIPIIICSVEEKISSIQRFTQIHKVSAYVLKGRNGLKDLKEAVKTVFDGGNYFSESIRSFTKKKSPFEINEYDISLLTHLSKGLSQAQIANHFSTGGITPSSLSSIEKRLNKLKDILKATNNVQLISNAKDLGLI